MNFEEAILLMEQLNKRGMHPGLEGVGLLCAALNNPQKDQKYIQVVGTNGKGSTSLFIERILMAMGLKVGVFASPAVFSDMEIISVNGRNISKQDYVNLVERVSSMNTFGCTRFEVETVMAFLYFKEKNCDVVILEAGMGGALDSTNVVKDNLASVFTAIGLDHTQYLGDTVAAIAENKAGVIKPGSPAITTIQKQEALDSIKEKAEAVGSRLYISDFLLAERIRHTKEYTSFSYKGMKDLKISLLGCYQVQNACLAIDTVKAIYADKVSDAHIRKGLIQAKEEGRFERILDKPVFILDGAHNEPASIRLRESLETYFTKKKFIYIMGMLKDKDVETVVKNTVDIASCVFTVATRKKERTMSAFELADIVRQYNPMVSSLDSVDEAVEMALMMADKDTVIVAFGSLSHLSDVKNAVKNRKSFMSDNHGVKND